MTIVDIDWEATDSEFIIKLGEEYWKPELQDSDTKVFSPREDWEFFYELVNGPLGGMQGNSNYVMTTYGYLLRDMAHEFYVQSWYARNMNEKAALVDTQQYTDFYLTDPTGQPVDFDAEIIADYWADDHGDIKRIHDIWLWNHSLLDTPMKRLQKKQPINYVKLVVPESWRAVEKKIRYRLDGEEQTDEIWYCPEQEELIDALSGWLWDEYPYNTEYNDFSFTAKFFSLVDGEPKRTERVLEILEDA